jgi:F-type H+-transporting ATPase subunit c
MDAINGAFIVKAAAAFGAALVMAIGSVGPSLGQGMIGKQACESISKYPESANNVRLTMMIAMGFTESSAVYCLIIAILLIFFVALG